MNEGTGQPRESLASDGSSPRWHGLESKFEVLGTLGSGGMGLVLKARHRAMDRVRAVKLLTGKGARDRAVIERFRREATIASDLAHPNIVRVFDFDHAPDGTPYIAMELLDGVDLEHVVAHEAPLDAQRVVTLLEGVADALDRVHAMGVVHRDIKPANLFLTESGVVKVLDFGISHVDTGSTALTERDAVLGTPAYMAPEQLEGKPVDGRTDVYALTAVAYELVTGRRCVDASTPAALVYDVLMKAPRPAGQLNASVPPHVEAALAQGLAKAPEERFATAMDLVRALRGEGPLGVATTQLAGSSLRSQNSLHRNRSLRGRHKRWPWLAGLAGLAVLAAAGAAWLGNPPARPVGEPSEKSEAPAVAVLTPRVDPDLQQAEWIRNATATLIEKHLALDGRVRVVSREETVKRFEGSELPSTPESIDELRAKLGIPLNVSLVLASDVTRLGEKVLVRVSGLDLATGERNHTGSFAGAGLDEAVEEASFAMTTVWAERQGLREPTPRQVQQCGVSDARCFEVLALERAVVREGLWRRAKRLADGLGQAPDVALWPVLVGYPPCLLEASPGKCLEGVVLPAPPHALGEDRKALWDCFAKAVRGETVPRQTAQRLSQQEDPLVRTFSQMLPGFEAPDEPLRTACRLADTHLDRLNCLTASTLQDDPKTAFRYFEILATQDLAEPTVMSGFVLLPMDRDLTVAETWLQRARARAGDHDARLANALAKLYAATRDPSEALIWARRSQHPLVREGAALLVEGRMKLGFDKCMRASATILSPFPRVDASLVSIVVRPSLSAIVATRSPELAGIWVDVMGPLADRSPALSAATRLATAIRDGSPIPCSASSPGMDELRIELLYLCGKSATVVAEARKRDEHGFDERTSRFFVAEAHLQEGNLDEAMTLFTRVESDANLRSNQPVMAMLALERLGRLEEKRGRDSAARAHYEALLRYWGRIDIPMREVAHATARLEVLRRTASAPAGHTPR